jgi:hypothetical protein
MIDSPGNLHNAAQVKNVGCKSLHTLLVAT